MSEEWGPWVEHCGTFRPADGVLVDRVYADGLRVVGFLGDTFWREETEPYDGQKFACSWLCDTPGEFIPVVRYRIKKPKGLTICESLLANLPKDVDA